MMNSEQFDKVAKKLFEALPTSVQNLEKDIQKKFHDVLLATFQKMDLITRDEFDTQTKVLIKTREKVDSLQAQLDALLAKKHKGS
ncbi:accessory factor UbiK family protein [Legionella sp. W05-934-2]|uniref:accessory factor UbiK family protein n=1 Tax=Legionella sp. W05-934-2 TaxID=1198649 RepID=UPI00346295A3